MTRRGSLVYYFSSVVCGTLFVAAAYQAHSAYEWGVGNRWARDFLFVYFLAVIAGILPQLLFAFLVRRATGLLRWRAAWQWLVAGAIVGTAFLWILNWVGYSLEGTHFPQDRQTLKSVLVFPFVGPIMFTAKPFWLPPLAFAATGFVLYRVHRAFDSNEASGP